jgi:hypothetical protein
MQWIRFALEGEGYIQSIRDSKEPNPVGHYESNSQHKVSHDQAAQRLAEGV